MKIKALSVIVFRMKTQSNFFKLWPNFQRMLFLTKYLCMFAVLAVFYGTCQIDYIDNVLSNYAKIIVLLVVSWHFGALLYKSYVMYKLGVINPKGKAVLITGRCDN